MSASTLGMTLGGIVRNANGFILHGPWAKGLGARNSQRAKREDATHTRKPNGEERGPGQSRHLIDVLELSFFVGLSYCRAAPRLHRSSIHTSSPAFS